MNFLEINSLFPVFLVAMLLSMGVAGCLDSASDPESDSEPEGDENDSIGDGGAESGMIENNSTSTLSGGENETGSNKGPEWPPLESAPIRPGANIIGCTTNFVFWDSVNDTVYMGTAAHCVQQLNIGDNVTIYEGEFPAIIGGNTGVTAEGILAYSGWWTGSGFDRDHGEDFALIKIFEDDRGKVHPKMLHYGGPTGLAKEPDVEITDRVLWYGSSAFHRQHLDPLQPNEGYVCGFGTSSDDLVMFYAVGPAVPGDSGSPVVVAKNGMAVAIATNLSPVSSSCLSTSVVGPWLYMALEEANDRGMNVELATWPLENEGRLPDLPT